jgi:4,5-DOPA dioxygenase extradiol
MTHCPRVLFLSHGGGPLPLLDDTEHQELIDCLSKIAIKINKPSAILVISAHWEAPVATITSSENPPLFYDYYGFPQQAYNIKYPCPGLPSLANRIHAALSKAGIVSKLDDHRGFDHGLFVPAKIMFPQADIPCVQLSLLNNLDPARHIEMGRELQALDIDNLLVIGSGFSFHNMRAFFGPENADSKAKNAAFESWLLETCSSTDMDEKTRENRLIQWAQAPAARYCHPREEHLLPLHVCYGLSNRPCTKTFELKILNKKASMYLWD